MSTFPDLSAFTRTLVQFAKQAGTPRIPWRSSRPPYPVSALLCTFPHFVQLIIPPISPSTGAAFVSFAHTIKPHKFAEKGPQVWWGGVLFFAGRFFTRGYWAGRYLIRGKYSEGAP